MEPDPERAPGRGTRHALGKWHRRAALQRLHDGNTVLQPVIVGGLGRFIGDPRLAENLPRAVEAYDHRDVHRIRAQQRRRPPAGIESLDGLLDGVDPSVLGARWCRQQDKRQRCGNCDAARAASGAHLISEATCTFTILSGSVTVPPGEPGGAFFSLSTTSMPCTTSPITVY